MSSLSNVTNPNPEEKAKLPDQVRAHSLNPLLTAFYWQEKRTVQSALSKTAVTHLPSPANSAFMHKNRTVLL